LDEAERLYLEGLEIFREIGNRQGESRTLNGLGQIALNRGHLDEAERLHRGALAIDRSLGDLKGESHELTILGNIAKTRGDLEEAERLHRQSVRIKLEIDIPLGDWYVEHGYTDPDAEWDFPPPETSD
jgi:tetratricopeptide (TPR) repeat protein